MAAEYVAVGAANTTSGAAIDVEIPSGNNGELLLLVTWNNTTGTCPTPTGWTTGQDVSIPAANGTSTQITARIKYRERDGTEGSVVNIDPSGTCTAFVMAISGANIDNPFGAYQTENSILTDQIALASPGFMAAGQLALCISGGAGAAAAAAASGGTNLTWTEAIDPSTPVTIDIAVNVAEASAETILPQQELTCVNGATACEAFTILISPDDVRDEFITSTGTSSFNVPAGVTAVTLICVGAGGGGSVTTGAEGGGGGGAYAQTNDLTCGDADTIYRSVPTGGAAGAAGGDCWLRLNTNSAPSSTTDGCLAKGGSGGAAAGSGGGAGGVTSTSVGDVKFAGGAGANGQGGGGSRAGSGGGSSAGANDTGNNGSAGSGSTAGPGGIATASGLARGGYGGPSAGAGIAGFVPGGGGGGGGNSGGNSGAGGIGRARMVMTLVPPATVGRATETDTASARGMAAGHGQSNETSTAFAPSAPTQVLSIGKTAPVRVGFIEAAGTANGSGTGSVGLTTLDIRPGDYVVAHVGVQLNTDQDITISGNNSGAYDELQEVYVNGVNDLNHQISAKQQGATVDTTLSLINLGASSRFVAQIAVFYGVNPVDYLQSNSGSTNASTSNVSMQPFNDSNTPNSSLLLAFYAATMDNAQTWTTPPANLTGFSQVDDQDSSGHGARLGFGYSIHVDGSGDFTPGTATNSGATANDTASGHSIALKPAVGAYERDTASTRGVGLGVNRANETDTAFALSQGIIQLPVGQANETDTAFKAGGIAMSPNRPIETDTAFNRGIILPVKRADETDTAFERPRLGGVGVSIEADTAFALGKVFILPIGRAPVANGDFSSNYLSEWADFDATISVVAGRLRIVADNTISVMATATFPSTGAAFGIGNVVRLQGQGFAGTANAVVRFSNGAETAAGQPFTNTAFDLTHSLTNTSVKIDCSLNDLGAVSIGQFAEFDNFVITTWPREVDTAFALNRLDTGFVGQANETDSAFSLVYGVPVTRANETDTAFTRTAIFIRSVSRSDEVDNAFQLNRLVTLPVARSNETDTASRLGFGSPAVRANEINTAFARNALITVGHGYSSEIDTAFQMFGALEAGSGRKPYIDMRGLLRERIQPVHKTL